MTVDLSRVRKGDTAVFLSGGKLTVYEVERMDKKLSLYFKPETHRYRIVHEYSNDGCSHTCALVNIIEIIPAPFSFSDLKVGMALRSPLETESFIIVSGMQERGFSYISVNGAGWRGCETLRELERAPQHDIEVKP